MSDSRHYTTAPEDRIPFSHKLIYGVGAFINNLLAAASGGMMIVLNLGLGMNPALVGLLGALPRITDAFTDPVMGFISDHTRSKWGRRRPYIFAGAILSGIIFALLWQLPEGQSETFYFVYFLLGSILFYAAYTVFATPWVALGYELTPDYHERTRLMGVQNFFGQIAYIVSPWFLWIMTYKGFFDNQVSGAAGLAIIIAVFTIAVGIIPAIFLKERFKEIALSETEKSERDAAKTKSFLGGIKEFFGSFSTVLKSKNFLLLCAATFLVFNGFMLISSFQFYVIIYYVFSGDQMTGAEYAGYAGTIGAISTFAVVALVTWMATKIGKRKAFFVSTGVSMLGYALKWVCYNPSYPWLLLLPAPLLAFSLGGLFTLMPSMIADVVDTDEIVTKERREGMFGSIFWFMVKLGMAAALAGGGYILNATGFDVALGGAQSATTIFLLRLFDAGFPTLTSALAIWAIYVYPITEERAYQTRKELERRRGPASVTTGAPALQLQTSQLKISSIIMDNNIDVKVNELMSKMTLDQKIGQMTQTERLSITPAEVKEYHIGSVLSGGGSLPGDNNPVDWVKMNDAYWAASMEEDENHLAIPLLYGVDAIHGNNNVKGATVFPHNIGLGAANDPELIQKVARITAREILATGVEWTFAPTLAVVRNEKWGRTYESYSEDPAIVKTYAYNFISAMQGDFGRDSVVACAKHWVGDGGTNGIDQGETTLPYSELERLHIAPYYDAIAAGVLTVMASYNSWNGNKCHGHEYLLTEVLKNKMGFQGFVISDWNGTDQLSKDYSEAIALSVNAGVDMFMVPEKWKQFIELLKKHVENGTVSMERIDDAVRRILRVKFIYGLFEKQRPAERYWSDHKSFGSAEHREVAREAVRKSLVLLKNDDNILPVKKEAKILVAGKNAHNRGHQCGGFTVLWQGATDNDTIVGGTSVWEGIKNVAPNAVLNPDGSEAEKGKFDVAIVVIGEKPYAEGLGDIRPDGSIGAGSQFIRPDLQLKPYSGTLELSRMHPEDIETINRITAKGIPVVAILISGRPLVVNRELAESKAFVAAWLPGSEGAGVSDVMFGDYDFQGKLSFSWPKKEDELWNKGDDNYDPLFPYGFGLRYTAV